MENEKKTLETIKAKIDVTKGRCNSTVTSLKEQASQVFDVMMKSKAILLTKSLSKLESSTELAGDECGELYQWVRFDPSEFIDDTDDPFQRELFENYMSENGAYVDWEYNTLRQFIGGYIGINEDGDVYDSEFCHSKKGLIASKRDYETTEERNALIEAYMEKTGCYPSVVSTDRYGNAFYVNTVKGK